MREFSGKTALITGAANGFGREIALECGRRDMRLMLGDIDGATLEAFESELKGQGREVACAAADISLYESVQALVRLATERFGSLDLLVNNAGVYYIGKVWDMPPRDVQWMMDVNVLSVFYAVHEAVPVMRAQGTPCHIVNVASLAGLITTRTMAAYHASKHAVVAASEAMLYDLQSKEGNNIGLSVFCPGYVQTDLHNCHRHRPGRYTDDADPYYQSDTYRNNLRLVDKFITGGEPVDVVVPSVFSAIEENRFYASTENTYRMFAGMVEKRADNIVNRRNPG